jgi:hypothetical protein
MSVKDLLGENFRKRTEKENKIQAERIEMQNNIKNFREDSHNTFDKVINPKIKELVVSFGENGASASPSQFQKINYGAGVASFSATLNGCKIQIDFVEDILQSKIDVYYYLSGSYKFEHIDSYWPKNLTTDEIDKKLEKHIIEILKKPN